MQSKASYCLSLLPAIGSDDPSLTDPEDQLGEVEAADVSPFKQRPAVACVKFHMPYKLLLDATHI